MIYDKFLEDYCTLKLSIAIFMNKMFELNIDLWMCLREETLQNKVKSKIILTILFEQTVQVNWFMFCPDVLKCVKNCWTNFINLPVIFFFEGYAAAFTLTIVHN